MSLTDPRALVRIIEELSDRLASWSVRTTDHLAEVEATQRCGHETVERGRMRARSVHGRAGDDQQRAAHARASVRTILYAAAAAVAQASTDRERVRRARDAADAAHVHCTHALLMAEERLARATAEEARARAALERARGELRDAQSRLNAAEAALAAARGRREYVGRDRDGKDQYRDVNLAPYQQAVLSARNDVRRAEQRVRECEDRLTAAIIERQAAEAHVARCRHALACAEGARKAGAAALSWADEAGTHADRAHEDAERADLAAAAAEQCAAEQLDLAEQAVVRSNRASDHCDAARARVSEAEREANAAIAVSTDARHDLQFRVEQLLAFDA